MMYSYVQPTSARAHTYTHTHTRTHMESNGQADRQTDRQGVQQNVPWKHRSVIHSNR